MKNNKINTVYKRIRDVREDKDQSQAEVAEKLKLYVTQYRRYENADTPVTADFIKKFAELFNVSTDYLLGLTNDKRKFW